MPSLVGSFLIARHALQDPNFRQSVVLLLKHGEDGAFGLVVNRPQEADEVPFEVFCGGPCEMDGFLMLHGHRDWVPPDQLADMQIATGIYLGDASCMTRVNDAPPGQELRVRVFSGYAGWGPDQLEGEIAAGAWALVPATSAALFETPPDEMWDNLIPPRIPRPSVN